jgi:radical SAM protein with 4Fe4S-binding SPASM domain
MNMLRQDPYLAGIKISRKFISDRALFQPLAIDIEPTNSCNFGCGHCLSPRLEQKTDTLDLPSFIKIMRQFPKARVVKLSGIGESFLNKDLVGMIEFCRGRKLQVVLYTNGSLLNRGLSRRLATMKNVNIGFSVDAATAETFEAIKKGADFNAVMDNIRYLAGIRGDNKSLFLCAWTVVTKSNISELPEIVRLSKGLGLDSITLQPFLSDFGDKKIRAANDALRIDPASRGTQDIFSEASRIAERLGIPLYVNYNNFYSDRNKCAQPWTNTYIAANGDVIPCCALSNASVIKMGNIFKNDFKTIWNSPEYRQLRSGIMTGKLPDYCRGCYRTINDR